MTSHRGMKNTVSFVAERRKARILRDKVRATRTSVQQLATLDKRLGAGVGAKKERARLV